MKGEEIVVLIDCEATHNFISKKLVNEMKLHTKETSHYGVIPDSGTAIKRKGVCENVERMESDSRFFTLGVRRGGCNFRDAVAIFSGC